MSENKEVKYSCNVSKKCGGCRYIGMTYEQQLDKKQEYVNRVLKEFGKIKRIIGMENPYNYRNKVQAAFGFTRSGKIVSGVYQSKSHRIVCVDSCRLEDKKAVMTLEADVDESVIISAITDGGYEFVKFELFAFKL